jgi:hypothetical protein
MNDTFSSQRLYSLFKWQFGKLDWRMFAVISFAIALLIYTQVKFYSPRTDQFSSQNSYFIFSIVIVVNFFKQLTDKETIARFLTLPSSKIEKFVFVAGGALFLPMLYLLGLMWVGDILGHHIYSLPDSYHILTFSSGSYIFFFATMTFFIHCLKQNKWMWGASSLFIVLMLVIVAKSYLREYPMNAATADMISLYLPVGALIFSLMLLVSAYRMFEMSEITRFKNYWKN